MRKDTLVIIVVLYCWPLFMYYIGFVYMSQKLSIYPYKSFQKEEYAVLLIFLVSAITIAVIILGASYLLAKQNPDAEKLSAYECGFEPYEDTRNVFDIKFCVVAILFIIFDIEIMFVIPWCVSTVKLDLLGFWSLVEFLVELGVGVFYAWYLKAFDWD